MPRRVALAVLGILAAVGVAHAEPTGAHPRLILDDAVRAAWKRQAKDSDSVVAAAIGQCDRIRKDPKEYQRDLYMGLDWAQRIYACLIAWVATDKDAYAKTAMIYFKANLDDLDVVGDGKGGDKAARRDAGFAMRAMGPSTALAYDWLHDHADMTDDLRKLARQRFDAWTTWYASDGYRARNPGSNYHAGYLVAVTFIAIAQGGEAGKTGKALWTRVKDELWGQDMAKALEPGGVLDGGDWAEGWQYGPLAVAEYALAAREMARQGVAVDGIDTWLEGVLKHNVYARAPNGGVFVNGDTQDGVANLKPRYLAYATPLIGDASKQVWGWAAAELADIGVREDEFPLYGAVAEAREVEPVEIPRTSWPTSYLSVGTGTFYTRTTWNDDAVWLVASCTKTIDTDHFHMDAGNVVVSRGVDDVIVDPSPYATLSSLTSNAPTVRSGQLPDNYVPSQAGWSYATRFVWTRQTKSGVVAARCDYADQYRIQETDSDVPFAVRDLVLLPYAGGTSAALVVIDRAKSGAKDRELDLRFKTPAKLSGDGDLVTGKVGKTALAIRRVRSSGGKLVAQKVPRGDCFSDKVTRGNCEESRFDVEEARLIVPGPEMSAWQVIDLAAKGTAAPDAAALDGADGVVLTRGDHVAVVAMAGGKDVTYTAPPGTHVILDAAATKGQAVVSAKAAGKACMVTVASKGDGALVDAAPVVVAFDATCAITEDVMVTSGPDVVADVGDDDEDDAGSGTGTGTGTGDVGNGPRTARTGCCGASASSGSTTALALLVLVGLVTCPRRRR